MYHTNILSNYNISSYKLFINLTYYLLSFSNKYYIMYGKSNFDVTTIILQW